MQKHTEIQQNAYTLYTQNIHSELGKLFKSPLCLSSFGGTIDHLGASPFPGSESRIGGTAMMDSQSVTAICELLLVIIGLISLVMIKKE